MYNQFINTNIGWLEIRASDYAVTAILFDADSANTENGNAITQQCYLELKEYFAGKRDRFTVPVDPQGTEFQRQVWQALQAIGFGETCSYGDIANQLNNPKAVRAVGAANGKNPIPVIIPCHRVIGASGKLTGYAGGLDKKKRLLNLEGVKTAN